MLQTMHLHKSTAVTIEHLQGGKRVGVAAPLLTGRSFGRDEKDGDDMRLDIV